MGHELLEGSLKYCAFFFLAMVMTFSSQAGEFEKYTWRLGFLVGQGHYQVTLKITYDYARGDQFDPSALALPIDDNLQVYKVQFKVDGDRANPFEMEQATWWSHGKSVPTLIPEEEGERVQAEVLYIIKNLFLIPPAPTNLPIPVNRLESGFAPIPGFELTGSFIGSTYDFKSKRIAARVGEPRHVYGIWRRNVPAATQQELLFLIPKSFTFSFNNLRAAQWDPVSATPNPTSIGAILGGTGGQNSGTAGGGNQDTAAGHNGFSISGDLKPYSANFYKGNPNRDWEYVLTWLQQERTYLPFGIQPGGAVKSRTLFLGAGDHTDDLLPWVDATAIEGDAVVDVEVPAEEMNAEEATSLLENLEMYLEDFRATIQINRKRSRLIASTDKDGHVSPAQANRELANAIASEFQLHTAPALTSVYPLDRVAALPLSSFDGVVTGIKVGKNWFFVDAANPAWSFERSLLFLKGHSIVILEEGNVQMGAF